eukprot:CAMPEP_0185518014 /NCGR_PEP_ID=MMETSP1366-20130426/70366_1 /TAXON_ID=38817 /ORGANISM="Gephyrocapsa oceanica, Strain RCC1303" /LENGTH=281 /DNA_ID=CAMNT_0028129013 /DNA_START=50 /DNA_END=895 /DNA_ORIENTATION=-
MDGAEEETEGLGRGRCRGQGVSARGDGLRQGTSALGALGHAAALLPRLFEREADARIERRGAAREDDGSDGAGERDGGDGGVRLDEARGVARGGGGGCDAAVEEARQQVGEEQCAGGTAAAVVKEVVCVQVVRAKQLRREHHEVRPDGAEGRAREEGPGEQQRVRVRRRRCRTVEHIPPRGVRQLRHRKLRRQQQPVCDHHPDAEHDDDDAPRLPAPHEEALRRVAADQPSERVPRREESDKLGDQPGVAAARADQLADVGRKEVPSPDGGASGEPQQPRV